VHEEENPDQKAIRLLNRQLGQLQTVRGLNHKSAEFKAWHDATCEILGKFLGPDSHHTSRFRNTRFFGQVTVTRFGSRPLPLGHVSREDLDAFRIGCETFDASLRAAIRHVEDFGVHIEEYKSAGRSRNRSGGISQNFHGPTQVNQAIAADSAAQKVGNIGSKTGADLKEIADLLQQSQELSPNQVRQGITDVEVLSGQVELPEDKRNWRAVLERGERVLELTGRAVDLGAKLAAHLPAVIALIEKAKHFLK
jgi:hypothetical protein